MDRSTISRIEEWDSRSSSGGYLGLGELADGEFTGAVEAGGTHLFMLNGRVVGVFDGDIDAFEGADLVAYESPDPSLPLLFAMQERGGEVRGNYYTDDTPIREVDETLTSSGFTGYLELSDNVLSGDYFVVYYGGRSLSAAFVGNEGRTVTGDEAFDLAADEVGIYEVRAVDLEVTDVPEPPDDGDAVAAAAAGTGESADETSADADEAEPVDVDDAEPTEGDEDIEGGEAVEEPETTAEAMDDAGDEEEAEDVAEPEGADEPEEIETAEEPAEADEPTDDAVGPGSAAEAEGSAPIQEAEPTDAGPEPDAPDEREDEGERGAVEGSAAGPAGEAPPRPERTEPDERFEEEARWREAATVPALDPDESASTEDSADAGVEPDHGRASDRAEPDATEDGTVLRQRVQRLEEELEETDRERRRLDHELEEALSERDDLAREREALAERIEELEARIEAAESSGGSGAAGGAPASASQSGGGRAVDPETALDQTDLFVRYGSKTQPTLETAHAGRAGAEEVAENLRIETHSRFDTNTATVEGRPFTEYLEGTIQYRFVTWLVRELLYEIQETGTESGLRALYDVLPELDRAEFNGTVTTADEEGEEGSEVFDVVCRDRMGKPLIVANINDSLDPASGDMMVRLVEDGTDAAEVHESMGAAFLVTASFFEPSALETAAEATRGGGFLSRDSKKSFVKLARNGGYHLCLVEARGNDFHVAVPEF